MAIDLKDNPNKAELKTKADALTAAVATYGKNSKEAKRANADLMRCLKKATNTTI